MRKILVLRGGALGDFVVTLPALLALGHRWPDATIELAGNAIAAELARTRGWIAGVHSQHEARWSRLYSSDPLPREFQEWLAAFDLIVSYWPDPEQCLARHLPVRTGQRVLTASAVPTIGPASRHYVRALEPLGVAIDAPDWIPLLTADMPAFFPKERPLALHPGSGSTKKNCRPECWLELLAHLSAPVLLVTGPAEQPRWDREMVSPALRQRVDEGTLRIAANLPLESLVAELSHCRAFVGHDSGVSHVAAATGIPCLLFFGPTEPSVWAPPAPTVNVVRCGPDLSTVSPDAFRAAVHAFVPGSVSAFPV